MNLSMNAPNGSAVFTLDLPPDEPTEITLAPGSGCSSIRRCPESASEKGPAPWPGKTTNIVQLLAAILPPSIGRSISARPASSSATAPHAEDYVRKDSRNRAALGDQGRRRDLA